MRMRPSSSSSNDEVIVAALLALPFVYRSGRSSTGRRSLKLANKQKRRSTGRRWLCAQVYVTPAVQFRSGAVSDPDRYNNIERQSYRMLLIIGGRPCVVFGGMAWRSQKLTCYCLPVCGLHAPPSTVTSPTWTLRPFQHHQQLPTASQSIH